MKKNMPHPSPRTIGIHVLGCDKNAADAEELAGMIVYHASGRVKVVPVSLEEPPPSLTAVIVYSCAFIHDAREESITALLEWCARKDAFGNPARVYAVGCLSQRYSEILPREMPEVDGFFGVDENALLAQHITANLFPAHEAGAEPEESAFRSRLDGKPYAFLKIGDGCDHACTFCAIPGIKGRMRSKRRETIMAEMGQLLEKGVREINLVAQDTSAYGRDRYDDYRLADLLADLCRIEGDFWIRCLYVYPSGITEALLHQLAMQPKVVPYLDIPLQHVSPRVLSAMGRPAQRSDTLELVKKVRRAVPGIALRTTMMVGFPGETEEEHQEMLAIVREAAFEWLGAFRFCPEEGTPAAKMRGKVPKKTARERYNTLMEMQAEITAQFNSARIGRRTRVLLEGFDEELHAWVGRSAAEAPEVDGNILVYPDPRLHSGAFVEVELLEACLYDVTGRAL